MGWAVAAYAATALAAAGSAYSQYSVGQQQGRMAEYNAKLAERDAKIAKQNAAYEASQKRRETERMLGRQRALYGKGGVTMEGSPLMVQEETAAEGEMDALMIERGYALRTQGFEAEAKLHRMKGSTARSAGAWGAGTTLLTSALGSK